jgi:hypothetical protein
MTDWKPRVRAGLRWESLHLTAEEGFLLSRVDGSTSVEGLRHLTGLSHGQVSAMLARLSASGAIEPAPAASYSAVDVAATALHERVDFTFEETQRKVRHDVDDIDDDDDEALIQAALASMNLDASLEGDATDEGDAIEDDDVLPAMTLQSHHAATRVEDPADDVADAADDAADDAREEAAADAAAESDAATEAADKEEAAADDEADSEVQVEEGNYRKLFETQLHPLPQEEREELARTGRGPTLLALCFDPVPHVIARLMENSEVGFPHARLIARYHRTPQGLDVIFKRSEFPRDTQVQRYLLANPMLNDPQLKRVLQPKPLAQVYKWSLSRELPEKNRTKVRQMLRSKWSVSDGEERANLVWATEGRCLQYLVGLQLDSKATTLLCQRSIHSVMLIQSLSRFTATPPPLLAHLARQPLVKRQPNLRTMIMQHPNCPSDIKRNKKA